MPEKKEYEIHQDIYSKTSAKLNKAELEIADLKSQLQQQTLPVVSEDVAKWIEHLKSKGYGPLKNPGTYGEAISELSDESLEKILTWISQHQEEFMRAWLDGYTVKKTQLFYLKNMLTGDCLAVCLARASSGLYVEVTEKWLTRKEQTSYKLYFTQQGIDSMHAESYEQIEVKE